MAVADAYSLDVEDPAAAMRIAKEFFERVGIVTKSSEKSVKARLHHPDGFDCIVKAKIRESSKASRLQLSKRSGDGFVFALVFKLIREALRVGIPPIFYHDQLFRRTARTVAPDNMPELVLPPTFHEWPKEQVLAFTGQHNDILNRIERGELDVRTFVQHVEKIPRYLLDARSIAPSAFNVFQTCDKISELISDATAFWG